jgi:hypothetical protein
MGWQEPVTQIWLIVTESGQDGFGKLMKALATFAITSNPTKLAASVVILFILGTPG